MPTVFISYQRDSESEVGEVRQKLSDAGFTVWQNVENIRQTDRWQIAIDYVPGGYLPDSINPKVAPLVLR